MKSIKSDGTSQTDSHGFPQTDSGCLFRYAIICLKRKLNEENMKQVLTLASAVLAGAALAYETPQLMAYRSFLPELKETARFAGMGIRLRTVFIANTVSANGRPYCQYPLVWKGFGDYDFSAADRQLDDILGVSPDAEFVVMLDLNTPIWLSRRLGCDSYLELTHALSKPKYREEARNYLDSLVRHLEKGYGGRIRCYLLMCGRVSEWFEPEVRQSPAVNAAWRAWCAERGLKGYGRSVPTEDVLAKAAFEDVIYDPTAEREKIDYWKFRSQTISGGVLEMAAVAKAASGGKPIGATYGYYMNADSVPGGLGNLDYERVVASPDFDIIVSPAIYTAREPGGGTGSQIVVGTARRYGKRFFYSIDCWPHAFLTPDGRPDTDPVKARTYYVGKYFKTAADTLAGNTRNAAFALVHHANFHWFDMWGGFYNTEGMHERIARIAGIQRRFAADDSAPYADVMLVVDPDSAYGRLDCRMAVGRPDRGMCPDGFRPSLGCGETPRNVVNRLGVVYDVCSFEDLAHLDLSRVKTVVLSDVWTITPEKAKLLNDHVLRDGRTALWVYAPGVSDGRTLDAERVREWSGAAFRTPGVTTTARDGWRSVYVYDYRTLTEAKTAEILKAAGCHFWTDRPTPVVANDHLLSVHVKEGGRWTVRLPKPCAKVVDLLNDRVVATDCTEFTDDFASPDTKIYETEYK